MKVIKATGLAAVVCSLLALCAAPAAAQPPYTPTLSVTAAGPSVTIQWTTVNEAQGYNIQVGTAPGAANIASVNLPNSVTKIVVSAPNGTYYLRVRALAGPYAGPFSNEASITVGGGGGGCNAPGVPAVSFTVAGPTVTVNWGGVANAVGYRIEFSRFAGATELAHVVGAQTTSFQQYIPMIGTFYARVVAGNACGQFATGNEVAFSITDLNGSGPRTPDPPPGVLLPVPAYGEAVSYAVAAQYPGDLANVCHSPTYLYRLVRELRKHDSRWGLNWKRGWAGSLSSDIVTYNPTNRPDNGESQIYLFDVVYQICAANGPAWFNVTHETWAARGNPACGSEWCAGWTIDPYLAAGFPPDQK